MEQDTLAESVASSLMAPPSMYEGAPLEPPAVLFLSGGSQHGAFGAGLLENWKKTSRTGHLPTFRTVAGISTGAILATFAFVDRPEIAAERYQIDNERELLEPFVTLKENGDLTDSAYVTMVRKGALADLAPLRGQLHQVLDNRILDAVRDGANDGRKLFVGVVDVDMGQAIAIDLTDLAERYFSPHEGETPASVKHCYVEAIVASSSAPMAALPVFIDNRMYVDGGVRFGAFSDEIGAVIDVSDKAYEAEKAKLASELEPRRSESLRELAHARPEVYLIINGDQELEPKCGKASQTQACKDNPDFSLEGEHAKWKFLGLAFRTEQTLVNQVYRFSADRIRLKARLAKSPLHFALIGEDMPQHQFTFPPGDTLDQGTASCRDWKTKDRALLNPVQFFPRYMRCLIDYGGDKAETLGWGRHEPHNDED